MLATNAAPADDSLISARLPERQAAVGVGQDEEPDSPLRSADFMMLIDEVVARLAGTTFVTTAPTKHG